MVAFQNPNLNFLTTTQVGVSLFVKQSGSFTCAQAGAGEGVVGISQPNAYTTLVAYAAPSGAPLAVYGESQECWLVAGGTITAGDRLKSDSSGRGVTAGATEASGAIALESGTVGNLYRVRVEIIIAPGAGATGATGPTGATGATGP